MDRVLVSDPCRHPIGNRVTMLTGLPADNSVCCQTTGSTFDFNYVFIHVYCVMPKGK